MLSLICAFPLSPFRSDWALDITPPGVDAETGWQYAPNFGISDDAWSAEYPPQSKRLLSTSGAMMSGPTSSRNHSHGSSSFSGSSSPLPYDQSWVRRRRWVRVMRRRLDIPPLAFMQPDGAMYHLTTDGSLVPCANDEDIGPGDAEGQELGNMPPNPLSLAQDYVARARYLVGNQSYDIGGDGTVPSAIEARRAIAKLERATTELRQGILGGTLCICCYQPHSCVLQEMTILNAEHKPRYCSRLIVGISKGVASLQVLRDCWSLSQMMIVPAIMKTRKGSFATQAIPLRKQLARLLYDRIPGLPAPERQLILRHTWPKQQNFVFPPTKRLRR